MIYSIAPKSRPRTRNTELFGDSRDNGQQTTDNSDDPHRCLGDVTASPDNSLCAARVTPSVAFFPACGPARCLGLPSPRRCCRFRPLPPRELSLSPYRHYIML